MAQVHRFHDKVAVWLGGGDTVYLTAEEAIKLGNKIAAYGRDVKACKFTDSEMGTFNATISDPENDDFTYRRIR